VHGAEFGRKTSLARVREVLRAWFQSKGATSVDFDENLRPEIDETHLDSRYVVGYEASFTPHALTKARVEVWVTHQGDLGIGFERKNRVAERLGVRGTGHDIFAAGLEPIEMSEDELISVLELAAGGQIALRVVRVPILGILSMKAFVPSGTKKSTGLEGLFWLRERRDRLPHVGQMLEYEPW
jgi:hypothetical protein